MTAPRHGWVGVPEGWDRFGASGPWPFVTRETHRAPDGREVTWSSRRHRKGRNRLGRRWRGDRPPAAHYWWAPRRVSWWIGALFMLGSACFAAASLPGAAEVVAPGSVAAVYFAGSVFFTTAAYLQYLEALNAEGRVGDTAPIRLLGVDVRRIDWWASSIQLAGTLFFNVSTFSAMIERLETPGQNLLVWSPDVLGSICFLLASALAVGEVCHRLVCLRARALEWWIVAANMVGSIAFGVSAVAAFVVPDTGELLNAFAATAWTLVGALCFLFGAFLLLPEAAVDEATAGLEGGPPEPLAAERPAHPA